MSSKRSVSSDKDKPPLEPDEQPPFYEELGRALSTWGGVEAALADIYGDAVNYDNPVPAKVAFWAIIAFDGKRQMADAAISTTIGQDTELLTKWQELCERLKSKSGSRNKLAHGTVVTMTWKKNSRTKRETFLAPKYNEHNVRKEIVIKVDDSSKPKFRDPRPKNRLSIKQIIQFRKDYTQLRKDLWAYADEFRAHIREQKDREPGIVIRAQSAHLPP